MTTLTMLILAIIQVESSGNDLAYNKLSGAAGCMQIKKILVADVNEHYGTKFTYDDRYDRGYSLAMFHYTMQRYATYQNLKKLPMPRDYAGIWKQGFSGYMKDPTGSDEYWEKIQREMHKLTVDNRY